MLTSDDKVGGWVKKGQNHDDVILEWSHSRDGRTFVYKAICWSQFLPPTFCLMRSCPFTSPPPPLDSGEDINPKVLSNGILR